LSSKNGVVSFPFIPFSSASFKASKIVLSINCLSIENSSGIGFAITTPPLSSKSHLAFKTLAISSSEFILLTLKSLSLV